MTRQINKQSKRFKKTYFLFCEWDTEVSYFSILKQIKDYNVIIKTDKKWQIPKQKDKIQSFHKKLYNCTGYSISDFKKTQSHIYVLVDIDVYSQTEADLIKKYIEDDNTTVIFSNQDFELRILLHISYYNKSDWNYIPEIQKIEKAYDKWMWNISFFESIITNDLDNALKNNKKLLKFHIDWGRTQLKDQNPYTEIHKLFKDIT